MSTLTRTNAAGRVQSPLASSQTLFESFCALTDRDYWQAAQFITSLVHPTATAAQALPTPQELKPHVVDIVYAVIKYMPRLDAILLSSDFLAANPDLVPHIALVKLLLFQFMATHFAYPATFLLPPDRKRNRPNDTVRWAADMLIDHKTKLHAAYARVRIEHQAFGSTDAQRLASLVDWSALKAVEQAPVAFRVRVPPTALLEAIHTCLPTWDVNEDVEWDKAQDDLIRVPGHLVGELLASPLIKSASVVVQDACASVPVQIVLDWLIPRTQQALMADNASESASDNPVPVVVLDTRATHETRLRLYQDYAPTLAKFVFPSPIASSFHAAATAPNMPWSGSTRLLERDSFLNLDPFDDDCDLAPDVIIVEPDNSQSAVLDEKHFLIQERTPKPVSSDDTTERLVKAQVEMLQHALKFSSAKFVLYMTRSTAAAENQGVVEACLEKNDDWRLMTVAELDKECADPTATDKNDSAVFHEDDGDEKTRLEQPEPVLEDVGWIEIPPHPPTVTCGIFVAVLARRAIVDQTPVQQGEQETQELVPGDESEAMTNQQQLEDEEADQASVRKQAKRKKKRNERFSLRAWRASMRNKDVSDLKVHGAALEVPLGRQMKALSFDSVKGDGQKKRGSSAFPILVPWK